MDGEEIGGEGDGLRVDNGGNSSDEADFTDDGFTGFQQGWTTRPEAFVGNRPGAFRDVGGPRIQHPDKARAAHYISLFYDEETWQRRVTGM